MNLETILTNKALNKWRLFLLISIPMSIIIGAEMLVTDLSVGKGISHMIGYSVRFAIPFIFLVVAASSMQILFPGTFTRWWLRNRKFIGLCFAVAMAWQGAFIFMVSTFTRDYYFSEIYYFRDELEGTIGYIFLGFMVLSSFQFGRKYFNPFEWKLVHKGGVYFLWAYPFSVYWWDLSYADPVQYYYVFYAMGFLAFASRIAAWGKRRQQTARKEDASSITPPTFKLAGYTLIAFGLVAAVASPFAQAQITDFLTGPAWSAELELWLPFWPLEPFLSLMTIGLGTKLATTTVKARVAEVVRGAETVQTTSDR